MRRWAAPVRHAAYFERFLDVLLDPSKLEWIVMRTYAMGVKSPQLSPTWTLISLPRGYESLLTKLAMMLQVLLDKVSLTLLLGASTGTPPWWAVAVMGVSQWQGIRCLLHRTLNYNEAPQAGGFRWVSRATLPSRR